MWKFRAAAIFTLGLAFSAKAVLFSDWPSVAVAVALLAMHSADRFFSRDRAEVKLMERMKKCEDDLAIVTSFVGQLKAGASLKSSLTGRLDGR